MISDKLPNKTVRVDDFRMSIQAEPWNDSVSIWIGHYGEGKNFNVNIGPDGNMIQTEMKEGVNLESKPFLKIPLKVFYQFAELFNKAEESVTQEAAIAELGAARRHLEDMRKLVFTMGGVEIEKKEDIDS